MSAPKNSRERTGAHRVKHFVIAVEEAISVPCDQTIDLIVSQQLSAYQQLLKLRERYASRAQFTPSRLKLTLVKDADILRPLRQLFCGYGVGHRAHLWPLGQLVQHIVSVRAGWFSGTLQDEDEAMNKYMAWGQRESPQRSAAELIHGLAETWAFIEARLQQWTPDDCAKTFPDEWDGQVFELSRSWVIYHVLEHDLHHGSEVSLILGIHKLPSLDL